MKLVGIIGATFCGSTIFSRILSSIPTVACPGEIHYLLDGLPSWMSTCCCYQHGESCPVLTPDLIEKATSNNVYDLLCTAYGDPDVIVSSDKSVYNYLKYNRLPDVYIVLVRDIVTHVASLARQYQSEAAAAAGINSFYLNELSIINTHSNSITTVVGFERFLEDPQKAIEWLNVVTSGVIPNAVVSFPTTFHHICGNHDAVLSLGLDAKRPSRWVLKESTAVEVKRIVSPAMKYLAGLEVPFWW